VERGAWLAFGLAFLMGIGLAAVGGWPIVALGLASLVAGAAYSGGPRPLSHLPLGELFVFLFFGLAAVGGSYYLQAQEITARALLAGAVMGLPAAAVLVVNNYRDRHTDARAGRRTLAVLLPAKASRREYALLMLAPLLLMPWLFQGGWPMLTPALLLPPALRLVARLFREEGAALNGVLAGTAGFQLLLGVVLSLVLFLR
jgi:1,4-dihydroxy-2-naphthoate octaprenyltransferase